MNTFYLQTSKKKENLEENWKWIWEKFLILLVAAVGKIVGKFSSEIRNLISVQVWKSCRYYVEYLVERFF